MMTRYFERRRFIRVPASGPLHWKTRRYSGHGELLDLSPGGACLRMPLRRAALVGETIDVVVNDPRGEGYAFPVAARVVRRTPDDHGRCVVGIEFDALSAVN
jgi:c-di-GMP-binding flagellar brake protein YcgR